MRNSRRKNNMKSVKDYIVPIVTFLLIFILIYVAFSGGDENEPIANPGIEQGSGVNNVNKVSLAFDSSETKALLVDQDDKKYSLNTGDGFVPGQTLKIEKGSISFTIPEEAAFSLNKNGELEYGLDSNMTLQSSSLWVQSENDIEVGMRFATVHVGKESVVNLEQNEVSSTLYLLQGTAKIENLSGVSTFLSPGKQIKISNKDASKDDVDLVSLKSDFDDYFKISDWYLQNNGSSIVIDNSQLSGEESDLLPGDSATGSLVKKTAPMTFSKLLSFDNIYDEGFVNTATTNISGKFADDSIAGVLIQGKRATINLETKTFNVLGVDTSKKSNDIIVKVFDSGENVIGKYVYTLHYNAGTAGATVSDFSKINAAPYPVNASDFIVSVPSVKDGETFSEENTFYGTVKNPDVVSVYVNGYKLKTFNGKTFRYHAYTRFKTLGEGVNNYEIKYLGADGKVILKKYVTINKKSQAVPSSDTAKKIISDEATAE